MAIIDIFIKGISIKLLIFSIKAKEMVFKVGDKDTIIINFSNLS